MTRITWGKVGDKRFETGIDRGVLYPKDSPGVPWNGLISVKENPSDTTVSPLHHDGVKYLDFLPGEEYQATIEAFMYPDEFESIIGQKATTPGLHFTNQGRQTFDLCYRTLIGNDTENTKHGYKIHLVYNLSVLPSSKTNQTNTQTVNMDNFQWPVKAVPVWSGCHRPTAHIVIDSRHISPVGLASIESILYGGPETDARMPTQDEAILHLAAFGPDEMLKASGPFEYPTWNIPLSIVGGNGALGDSSDSTYIDFEYGGPVATVGLSPMLDGSGENIELHMRLQVFADAAFTGAAEIFLATTPGAGNSAEEFASFSDGTTSGYAFAIGNEALGKIHEYVVPLSRNLWGATSYEEIYTKLRSQCYIDINAFSWFNGNDFPTFRVYDIWLQAPGGSYDIPDCYKPYEPTEYIIELIDHFYGPSGSSNAPETWHKDEDVSTTLSIVNNSLPAWSAHFDGDLTAVEGITNWRFEADIVSGPELPVGAQLKWTFEATGEDDFNQSYNWSGLTDIYGSMGMVVQEMGPPTYVTGDPFTMEEFLRRMTLEVDYNHAQFDLRSNYVDGSEIPVVLSGFRIIFYKG